MRVKILRDFFVPCWIEVKALVVEPLPWGDYTPVPSDFPQIVLSLQPAFPWDSLATILYLQKRIHHIFRLASPAIITLNPNFSNACLFIFPHKTADKVDHIILYYTTFGSKAASF